MQDNNTTVDFFPKPKTDPLLIQKLFLTNLCHSILNSFLNLEEANCDGLSRSIHSIVKKLDAEIERQPCNNKQSHILDNLLKSETSFAFSTYNLTRHIRGKMKEGKNNHYLKFPTLAVLICIDKILKSFESPELDILKGHVSLDLENFKKTGKFYKALYLAVLDIYNTVFKLRKITANSTDPIFSREKTFLYWMEHYFSHIKLTSIDKAAEKLEKTQNINFSLILQYDLILDYYSKVLESKKGINLLKINQDFLKWKDETFPEIRTLLASNSVYRIEEVVAQNINFSLILKYDLILDYYSRILKSKKGINLLKINQDFLKWKDETFPEIRTLLASNSVYRIEEVVAQDINFSLILKYDLILDYYSKVLESEKDINLLKINQDFLNWKDETFPEIRTLLASKSVQNGTHLNCRIELEFDIIRHYWSTLTQRAHNKTEIDNAVTNFLVWQNSVFPDLKHEIFARFIYHVTLKIIEFKQTGGENPPRHLFSQWMEKNYPEIPRRSLYELMHIFNTSDKIPQKANSFALFRDSQENATGFSSHPTIGLTNTTKAATKRKYLHSETEYPTPVPSSTVSADLELSTLATNRKNTTLGY